MNTTTPILRRLVLALTFAGALFGLVSTNVLARDTDIYFTDPSASGLKPNVQLILDTSGSMNEEIPDQTLCPGVDTAPNCLIQLQISPLTWPAKCNGAINQASCDYSTHMARVDHMKQAMQTIINDSTNINMGVMRFSRGKGAAVVYPMNDLDAIVADDGNLIAAMQHSADDAYESSGTVNITSTSYTFQTSNKVGVRFRNVYIPKGVHIVSAYVTFTASNSNSGTANISISADAADNALAYTTAANNISSRAQTSSVSWNGVPDWNNGTRYYTRDISGVVQEVVDRTNWQSGNAMAFQFSATAGTRQALAYDDYGSYAPKLVVTYVAGGGTTVTQTNTAVARVNLGTDDAEERVSGGNMTTAQSSGNPLQLTRDGIREQYVGVRFRNILVPQGATITSAQIEFTVSSQNATAASLTVDGEAADNSATFSGTSGNISSRAKTSGSVSVPWNNLPNPAVGQLLTTPNLTGIVQQIVNRGGWASGNAMAFIIKAQGATSGPRNVESYETAPGKAPYLRITYQTTVYVPSGAALTRTVRETLKATIVAMTAGGNTPIVDALYEGALYFRGNAVDYGKARENGTSGTDTHLLRVSNPLSYNGGTLSQPVGCTNADLEASACKGEQITGSATYISPVTAGCQSNHMVLLTDGAATANNSTTKVKTMTGASSCSGSGFEACGVTLTNYLANNDQFAAYVGTQPIHTHTIGFSFSSQYLSDLATNGKGIYQTANNADQVVSAFQEILNQVLSDPTGFVSPSLTVNAFNRLYDQNDVYFSVFSPQLAVGWQGNVKKYRLCGKGETCNFGEVMDANSATAIDPNTSKIKTSAESFWSGLTDGPVVDKGGAGSKIPAYTTNSRHVYTYTGAADVPASAVDLTAAAHVVDQAAVGTPDNANLTKSMLGNAAMTDQDYYNIVRWMRGEDMGDDNGNCPQGALITDACYTEDRWKFADALHSRPATVIYGGTATNPVTKIFVGTNDGGLRMINANNGTEEWIVYLPEFLPNMKTLMDNNNGEHIIGLDGAASVWVQDHNGNGKIEPGAPENDKVTLFIGMRRGGRNIYAFDVTPDSELTSPTATGGIKPKFLWRIKGGVPGEFAGLGQTWSYPQVATIRVKCDVASCNDNDSNTLDSKKKTVLIFGGGYDPAQDGVIPSGADAMGNGIYIVDPDNGSLVWRVGGTGSGAPLVMSEMKYAIPSDIGMVDSNDDGAVDRLYVGDTRGQVFRIDLSDQIDPSGSTPDLKNGGASGAGGSSGYVFADVGCTGGVRSNNCALTAKYDRRKFFYAPAIVQTRDTTYSATADYDLIALASGDREDPLDKITQDLSIDPVHNRIYAFRDFNYQYGSAPGVPSTHPTTLDESLLYDSTTNLLQDSKAAGYAVELADIKSKDGWYVDLRELTSTPTWVGEKGLAHPTVFAGVLYATTYIPPNGATVAPGTCPPPAEGTARLYGLNYLSGAGVVDLNGDKSIDRSIDIGGGIPSEVVVVSREGGTSALVGTSGGASQGNENPVLGTKQFKFDDKTWRIPTFWYDD